MKFTGTSGSVELLSMKPPAVAGMFYPAEPGALRAAVRRYLDEARVPSAAGAGPPKAIIAPHAGYQYSGPVAGSAYAALRAGGGAVRRVVLIGPAHRVAVDGVATSSARVFSSPAGNIEVDTAARTRLLELPGVTVNDAAFAEEHALEVQLPFIRELMPAAAIVPLLVGRADPALVDRVLETLWGGHETVLVVSSDLSHYHDHATAEARDTRTSAAIARLDDSAIGHRDACGRDAVNALLRQARRLGLQATVLDQRNSGDTAGGRDRVVGYGAYRFDAPATPRSAPAPVAEARDVMPATGLGLRARRVLLGIAANAIRHHFEHGHEERLDPATLDPALREDGAAFVTLKLDGRLRGCVGSLAASRPLGVDVAINACGAAFRDPRFPALRADEFEATAISISVLGKPRPLPVRDEADLLRQLRPGTDGLILTAPRHRSTFLPAVWESLPEPARFVRELKRKAGLDPDFWSTELTFSRYETQSFH